MAKETEPKSIGKDQRLPASDLELEGYIGSLSRSIRASFNDYALAVTTFSDSLHIPGIGRKQPIKIPALEDLISLFGLEKGVSWRIYGGDFGGFEDSGKILIGGNLTKEGGYATKTGIDLLDSWTREFYGTSSSTVFRRDNPNGSGLFVLRYEEPVEPGQEFIYGFDLKYVNYKGEHLATSYGESMVRKTKSLSYIDGAEGFGIHYHVPFFQLEKEGLTKSEVEQTYNLRERLKVTGKESEDSGLLTFLEQEEKEPDGTYNELKARLGLDKLPWHERPSVLTILRLNEMAQFLESRFRRKNGVTEVYYKDYQDRITAFRNNLWLLFRQQSPYPLSETNERVQHYTPERQWSPRELYPKGFGPFDPGPHNPSAPNDPRGPDPRGPSGLDPRGPR